MKTLFPALCLASAVLASCQQSTNTTDITELGSVTPAEMTFFLTSAGPGDGANLGGLEGADAHCASLATAAGAPLRIWRAYLSTTGDPGIDAKDRIGAGPWTNARGVIVATDVANLINADENNLNKGNSITERGEIINGRGDRPNRHDIMTGSGPDGTGTDATCANWTSNSEGSATVGHHDRVGGGQNPTHWSTAHGSRGCSQSALQSSGGDGLYYCFAVE